MVAINKGYVSIYREIAEHWIWEDKPFSFGQAWIDLILLANYKTEKFPYKDKIVEGQRGTVYRSISWLSDRWGWSRRKTKRFLSVLESDNMVSVNSTTSGTTLTLVNYGKFQDQGTTNVATKAQPVYQPAHSPRTHTIIINNSNNSNKYKGHFVPPTATDVTTYCNESGHRIDAEAFIDFYESKNWMVGKNKMKDWKAAVRNWERRDKEKPVGSARSKIQNFTPSNTDWDDLADQIMNSQSTQTSPPE